MSTTHSSSASQPLFTCWLRSGGLLTIWWDRLEAGPSMYPLADLRTLPPPDQGAGEGQAGVSFLTDPANERIFAGVAHLSLFFLPIVLPLVLWLALKDKLQYASDQAKQALWFHIIYPVALLALFLLLGVLTLVIVLVTGALGVAGSAGSAGQGSPLPLLPAITLGGIFGAVLFFVFWIGVLALAVGSIFLAITGAIRAFDGRPFHYPFLGRI